MYRYQIWMTFCRGSVLPSILVVFGQHCRLENLSDSGHYLQTERYTIHGEEVVHEAGSSAANRMVSWRALRQQSPEMFGRIRVWQSPTAFVDSVIYRWQSELEASEFASQIRIVDAFRAAWTEQAQEMNWLCNVCQVCV